jgi:hypothetical protein
MFWWPKKILVNQLARGCKKETAVKTKKTEVNIPSHWRIQGSSIRHSGIGKKLTQEDAGAIMSLLRKHAFYGRYNPDTGTIQEVCREGSVNQSWDLLYQLWERHGSESVKIARRQAAEVARKEKKAAKAEAIGSDLDRLSTEVVWIDQNLGEAEMNDYNKLTLAKYLAGESNQVPVVDWKWADPLQKLGAVIGKGMEQRADFEALKNRFDDLIKPTDTDAGPRM